MWAITAIDESGNRVFYAPHNGKPHGWINHDSSLPSHRFRYKADAEVRLNQLQPLFPNLAMMELVSNR